MSPPRVSRGHQSTDVCLQLSALKELKGGAKQENRYSRKRALAVEMLRLHCTHKTHLKG